MADCIFCMISQGKVPCHKVYEDEKCFAFLDIAPVSRGHVLVIPKEHAAKMHELSDESCPALMLAVKKVSKAVQEAFSCDFNILNNNGKMAGQAVHHVHFHVIPRRGIKEEFSFNWVPRKQQGDDDAKEILERIKERIIGSANKQ